MSNIYDMADTWNDAGTTFTAIKMNITDTASNAASLLMDLQVGGSTKFSVSKTGLPRFGTHSAIGSETITGYIDIEDSGGTPRKIAIVS